MGLEPTRYCYHRHLKPARLPIPPLLHVELTNAILAFHHPFVNIKFKIFFIKLFKIFLIFCLTFFPTLVIIIKSRGKRRVTNAEVSELADEQD